MKFNLNFNNPFINFNLKMEKINLNPAKHIHYIEFFIIKKLKTFIKIEVQIISHVEIENNIFDKKILGYSHFMIKNKTAKISVFNILKEYYKYNNELIKQIQLYCKKLGIKKIIFDIIPNTVNNFIELRCFYRENNYYNINKKYYIFEKII